MRKNIIQKFIIAILMVGMVSCTENFEEINIDPTTPVSVPTAYILTSAQRASQNYFNTTGLLYSQMWSETQYTNTSRYETAEASFYVAYREELADIQNIIDLNSDEVTAGSVLASGATKNQLAVARILKAWIFQNITDIWGDVPYSQALNGREAFNPVYDSQEDIYAGLVQELSEAITQIDEGSRGMDGDIIYDGDMTAWKKFAASLLLRVGIRMSEANSSLAQTAISTGLSAGVFDSNADNALYQYLSDAANDNPYFQHFLTRTDYAISDVMVGKLEELNDPRLNIYGDPAPNFGKVVGMPYGVSEAIAGSITNDDISFPGKAVRSATSPEIIMTYAEVLFIQAEAASRGFISGDAEALYSEAIQASMEYWGVESGDIDAYLAQPDVAYDASNPIESIMNQKWLGMYMQGLEAWSEWRRTGYPTLTPAPAAAEGRAIPCRRAYVADEYNLNKENVEAAVARQGADVMETRLWWDKN